MARLSLFLPNLSGGGAERIMLNLSKEFISRGHNIDLVLVNAKGEYISDIPEDVDVVNFNRSRTLSALPDLIQYLRENEPKGLLSTSTHANIISIWAKIISLCSTNIVVRQPNIPSMGMPTSLKERLLDFFISYFYPFADDIVAISHGGKEDLAKNYQIGSEKISVIHNPNNIEQIFRMKRERSGLPEFETDIVILGVGRLNEVKDFTTLIRSFNVLLQERSAELVILGKGNQRSKLEQLAADLQICDYVHLPGFVENPYKYMARADVFVLSSKWEGFGNVLVEAMACGTPVVSTDCPGGPREILQNGRYGKLVPVGDEIALAQAIKETLCTQSDPDHLIDRAMDFSIETKTTDYEELLLQI